MLIMVEVDFRDLKVHRDGSLICDDKFDEDMSEEEITKIFKPLVTNYLGHSNFRINSISEI